MGYNFLENEIAKDTEELHKNMFLMPDGCSRSIVMYDQKGCILLGELKVVKIQVMMLDLEAKKRGTC